MVKKSHSSDVLANQGLNFGGTSFYEYFRPFKEIHLLIFLTAAHRAFTTFCVLFVRFEAFFVENMAAAQHHLIFNFEFF
jgi:hypothetical protein